MKLTCGHCGGENLRPHCGSPGCTWLKCRECEAMNAGPRHSHKDDSNGLCTKGKK